MSNRIADEIIKYIPKNSAGMIGIASDEAPELSYVFDDLINIFDNNLCKGIFYYNG